MSSEEFVIRVEDVGKCYHIYDSPRDRLKQLVASGVRKLTTRYDRECSGAGNSHKYYREFWALRGVSFAIRRGETVGILGKNGSGKSTLLQLICGTLAPSSGKVEVQGRISALLELGSGFNPEYTGRENVFLNGRILGLGEKEIQARYHKIVEFADIGDFIEQPIKTYSSGMVVRLAFAVAINVDPEILVIDEALAVGDVGFQSKCFAKIAELKERGVTLLFVSHAPAAVTQLCSKALLLDRGELVLSGTPNQTIRAYNYLANAGPSSVEQVRREVVSLVEAEREFVREPEDTSSCETNVAIEPIRMSGGAAVESYFDRQLANTIRPTPFVKRGAEISDFAVTDKCGNRVNVLTLHHRFAVNCRVRFESAFENVRIAWVLRTPSGLSLGGGSTHAPGTGFAVEEGRQIEVKSNFVNFFSPGDYIIDIGVRGKSERDDEFIHGVSNAICVRSISYGQYFRNGVSDCLIDPAFEILDEKGVHLVGGDSSESPQQFREARAGNNE